MLFINAIIKLRLRLAGKMGLLVFGHEHGYQGSLSLQCFSKGIMGSCFS